MALEPIADTDEILLSFGQLKKALTDTSSIIYTQEAGYFAILGKTIQLYTIPEVISEIKSEVAGVRVVPPPGSPSLSTDRKLVACALEKRMALISEDKSVLSAMRRAQAPYYNALMMLNFLLYRQKINDDGYRHYLSALKHIARYNEAVWELGDYIYSAVKEMQKEWTSPVK